MSILLSETIKVIGSVKVKIQILEKTALRDSR